MEERSWSPDRGPLSRAPDPARWTATAALAGVLALGGCGDSGTGPEPVTAVVVTSPIEGVMALGRTVQLEAAARDGSGGTVPGQAFTWASSDGSVATVSGSGVVHGVAAGTATISASTDEVTGRLSMRVVAADLQTIAALLDDAYTQRLASFLQPATGDAVTAALADCGSALDTGYILQLDDCLQQLQAEAATDPTDRALLAVLGVIALRADLFLNL